MTPKDDGGPRVVPEIREGLEDAQDLLTFSILTVHLVRAACPCLSCSYPSSLSDHHPSIADTLGTHHIPYHPQIVNEGGVVQHFRAISAMPEYRNFSFEELRLHNHKRTERQAQDKQADRVGTCCRNCTGWLLVTTSFSLRPSHVLLHQPCRSDTAFGAAAPLNNFPPSTVAFPRPVVQAALPKADTKGTKSSTPSSTPTFKFSSISFDFDSKPKAAAKAPRAEVRFTMPVAGTATEGE